MHEQEEQRTAVGAVYVYLRVSDCVLIHYAMPTTPYRIVISLYNVYVTVHGVLCAVCSALYILIVYDINCSSFAVVCI